MKRNSVMRLILLALVIALLATTFSACSLIDGFFDGYKPPTPTVTEVLPIHCNGLILVGDGEYTALVGQEFILDTMLNDNAPEQVTYRWYVTVDGQKSQVGEEKVLKYTFETYKAGKYEFSVTANNVASTESIVVSVEYPTNLTNLQITSSTHGIFDGVVQESADKIEEVQFAVSWDECAVPEDGEVSIAWAVVEYLSKQLKAKTLFAISKIVHNKNIFFNINYSLLICLQLNIFLFSIYFKRKIYYWFN